MKRKRSSIHEKEDDSPSKITKLNDSTRKDNSSTTRSTPAKKQTNTPQEDSTMTASTSVDKQRNSSRRSLR